MATERRGFGYTETMRAVLKTIDPVVLNYAAKVLEQEGIEAGGYLTLTAA